MIYIYNKTATEMLLPKRQKGVVKLWFKLIKVKLRFFQDSFSPHKQLNIDSAISLLIFARLNLDMNSSRFLFT